MAAAVSQNQQHEAALHQHKHELNRVKARQGRGREIMKKKKDNKENKRPDEQTMQ